MLIFVCLFYYYPLISTPQYIPIWAPGAFTFAAGKQGGGQGESFFVKCFWIGPCSRFSLAAKIFLRSHNYCLLVGSSFTSSGSFGGGIGGSTGGGCGGGIGGRAGVGGVSAPPPTQRPGRIPHASPVGLIPAWSPPWCALQFK
jgi:hypothetical protein